MAERPYEPPLIQRYAPFFANSPAKLPATARRVGLDRSEARSDRASDAADPERDPKVRDVEAERD